MRETALLRAMMLTMRARPVRPFRARSTRIHRAVAVTEKEGIGDQGDRGEVCFECGRDCPEALDSARGGR